MKKILLVVFAALLAAVTVSAQTAVNPLQLTSECGVDEYHPGMGVMKACMKDCTYATVNWRTSDNSASGTVYIGPCPSQCAGEWTYFSVPSAKTIIMSYGEFSATKAQNTNVCEIDYFPMPAPEPFAAIAAVALAGPAFGYLLIKRKK